MTETINGKPWAVDLCCGLGGWTSGLILEGFEVIGFDTQRFPTYPAHQVIQDIRLLSGAWLIGCRLIVASPPCQEFSNAHPRNQMSGHRPDLSIIQACYRIAQQAHAPLILENVHGAQRWLGPAAHHYGHFYLWGDGVPALLPQGPRWKDSAKCRARSPARRALIPIELARAIGHRYFTNPTLPRAPSELTDAAGAPRQA